VALGGEPRLELLRGQMPPGPLLGMVMQRTLRPALGTNRPLADELQGDQDALPIHRQLHADDAPVRVQAEQRGAMRFEGVRYRGLRKAAP
jgi:hypothetical protein